MSPLMTVLPRQNPAICATAQKPVGFDDWCVALRWNRSVGSRRAGRKCLSQSQPFCLYYLFLNVRSIVEKHKMQKMNFQKTRANPISLLQLHWKRASGQCVTAQRYTWTGKHSSLQERPGWQRAPKDEHDKQ